MLIGLLSDVHANLPALQAVLSAIRARRPDLILSLGDQVNLGPCPRETLAFLKSEGVVCLHGNHERYVLSAMRGDPVFHGTNFASLRFNAGLLSREEITFPESLVLEGITFCHAVPGDDAFPVYSAERALPALRARYGSGFTHIVCGHGHNPTQYALPHLRLDSIGSVGCMDDGVPGCAPYVMLRAEKGEAVLYPYYAAFDVRAMPPLFLSSGMAAYCPVMAHISCLQMMMGKDILVPFVTRARAIAAARGETEITPAVWSETDRVFDWPGGLSSREFWKKHAS